MQTTTHYALQKPDPNDTYNKATDNSNMDAVDTQMYNNAQAAAAAQTAANEATAAGAANDTVIGNRTADPTQVPNSLTGTLTQFLSWITNRIKAITGTANWYDNPPTTLTAAEAHMTNTNNPHNVTAAQVGAIPTTAEGVASGVATTDANNKVVQTANNSDQLGGQPASSYPLLGQANTFTGNQTAPAFAVSGLVGATAGARLVGGTTGGAPSSGTWSPGDLAIDQKGTAWVYASNVQESGDVWSGSNMLDAAGSTNYTYAQAVRVDKAVTVTGVLAYPKTAVPISAAIYSASGTLLSGSWPATVTPTLYVNTLIKLPSAVTMQPNTDYYVEINYATSSAYNYSLAQTTANTIVTSNGVKFTFASDGNYYRASGQVFANSTPIAETLQMGLEWNASINQWESLSSSSASGTWSPAAGTFNVAVGTTINVASIPSGAHSYKALDELDGAFYDGMTTSDGHTAFSYIYYQTTKTPQFVYVNSFSSTGVSSSSMPPLVNVQDGSYIAYGYFQIQNGYLQFVVTYKAAASGSQSNIQWVVA